MRTELILPFPSPSLNELNKLHWRKKHDLRKKWTNLIQVLVLSARRGPIVMHPGPVSISFTRQSPGTLDRDNYVGGLKLIQDAIKQAGLIKDDTEAIIAKPVYEQVTVHRTQARTIIIIEDLPIASP